MPAPLPISLERRTRLHPIGIALLVSGLLILWIGQYTDLDLLLADAMFDHTLGVFPWQHAWLAERFNHEILKTVLQVLAVMAIVTAIVDLVRPRAGWTAARRTGVRVLGSAAVLVPSVISLLKRFSASHCPWDVQRYGGTEPYVRLLELVPSGISAGHCLPAGHASSALWLVALAVFWLPQRPRMAATVGAATLAFGFAVGWMQQLRGAHFLTHTLWSMWIAVSIVYCLYQLFRSHKRA